MRVLAGVGVILCALGLVSPVAAKSAPAALLELYTSEGCSSCPPADALLRELAAAARRDSTRIYCLAFHVDYWNRLGWRDPYSDAAFSERQAIYGGRFESRYTPQMVVNGAESFVGSDRVRATQAIEAALATAAAVDVQASGGTLVPGSGLRVEYQVTPVHRGAELHAALVERDLVSHVASGENRGRTLAHDNVVRVFRTVTLDAGPKGTLFLDLPAGVRRDHAGIVVYVQDPQSHHVLGATAFDLPALPSTP